MTQHLKIIPRPVKPVHLPEELIIEAIRPEFRIDVYRPNVGSMYRVCRVENCIAPSPAQRLPLCSKHASTYKRLYGHWALHGEVEQVARYLIDPALNGGPSLQTTPTYSFEGLPIKLANELRLALQSMHDEGLAHYHFYWASMVKVLRELGVNSVFELSTTTAHDLVMYWARDFPLEDRFTDVIKSTLSRGFIRRAMRLTAPFYAPIPVYDRDSWRPMDFGVDDVAIAYEAAIRFYNFRHPWMKEWVKQYALLRIKVKDVRYNTLLRHVSDIEIFDRFLAQYNEKVRGIKDLDRPIFDEYVLWLNSDKSNVQNKSRVGAKSSLVQLLRVHRMEEWTPKLRPTAEMRISKNSTTWDSVPQPIDPFVLKQLLNPEFLDVVDPVLKSYITILRYTGLRPSSMATLPFDCLTFSDEAEDSPVLKYGNVKKSRSERQPIMHRMVVDAIRAQQARVLARWPLGSPWLFPKDMKNPDGKFRRATASLYSMLNNQTFKNKRIVNREGNPVNFAPSEFRDTRATELLNSGTHPTIVAEYLGHRGTRSLDHYGRIQVETVRRELSGNTMVNVAGEVLPSLVGEDGLITDVEKQRQMIKRAANKVLGGVCTLPEHEACPHLNACFSCKKFATSIEFLPELLGHLQKSDMLVLSHEVNTRTRLAQKERQEGNRARRVVKVVFDLMEQHPEERTRVEDWLMAHEAELREVLAPLATSENEEQSTDEGG